MTPARTHDIVALGFRAMLSGTLASLMGGAVVGAALT
jgi:nucleoside permease NupC